MGEAAYQLFQRDLKSLGHAKQGDHCHRAASFKHLPVANAKAERQHVLLAELALSSVGSNSVPQRTKQPRVMSRQFSAGTHYSRLGFHEQKDHEQKCILLSNMHLHLGWRSCPSIIESGKPRSEQGG